jgi:hypothetical protein
MSSKIIAITLLFSACAEPAPTQATQTETLSTQFTKTPPAPSEPCIIEGVVLFEGSRPKLREWTLEQDMVQISKVKVLKDEALIIDENRHVANTIVTLIPSQKRQKTNKRPEAEALFEKVACRYQPRVLVVREGTTVTVGNRNSPCNGFKFKSVKNPMMNLNIIAGNQSKERFDRAEVIKVNCDNRPYMDGFIVVVKTPYFAKTKSDGRFQFAVPPGHYTIKAWHEMVGSIQVKSVKVEAGDKKLIKINIRAKN